METSSIKLHKAYKLVNEHWFPFSFDVLGECIELSSRESADKESLISRIKKDASIFLLCLREISKNGVFKFIESASIEEIKNALITIKEKPASHSYKNISKLQQQRLSEMIVSSEVALKLTEGDQELYTITHSISLMRQLGLTLIAWNYPRIFEKVTSSQHSKDSLDSSFQEILGFSPPMLGYVILENWGLSKDYLETITSRGVLRKIKSVDPALEVKQLLNTRVSNICVVGEALARATNPSLYKTAEEDIELASEYIESFLGCDGVSKIIESSRKHLQEISIKVPSLLLSENRHELDRRIKTSKQSAILIKSNPYLDSLPGTLLRPATKLYKDVIPTSPAYNSVSLFTKEIFPLSGFTSFQVYLFDPFERKLYPSLILGRSRVIQVRPVFLRAVGGKYEMLAEAFKTNVPIQQNQILEDNEEQVVSFSASLGESNNLGVVYAEISQHVLDEMLASTRGEPLRYFKAFKILLSDCLGLV